MVTVNEKIKRIRIEKNIKQSDVARSANIKQPSYASIENGDTKSISIEVGKGIAKALGVSFNELFEIESIENSDIKAENESLKSENQQYKNTIAEQNNLISLLREQNEILKPFRLAFIQERTISELMVLATLETTKELNEKGKKIELTSFEVRKRAIAIYQKDFPDIQLNPFINLTPGELPKK